MVKVLPNLLAFHGQTSKSDGQNHERLQSMNTLKPLVHVAIKGHMTGVLEARATLTVPHCRLCPSVIRL